jgi:hypothetical protein
MMDDSRLGTHMEPRLNHDDIENYFDCLEANTDTRIRRQSYNEGFRSRSSSETTLRRDTGILRSKSLGDIKKPSCDEYLEFSKEWKKAKFVLGDSDEHPCVVDDFPEIPEHMQGNPNVTPEDVLAEQGHNEVNYDDDGNEVTEDMEYDASLENLVPTQKSNDIPDDTIKNLLSNNSFRIGLTIIMVCGFIYLTKVKRK